MLKNIPGIGNKECSDVKAGMNGRGGYKTLFLGK